MNEYRFELFKSGVLKRKFYFRFVSANDKTMFQSEGYSRRIDAVEAIKTIHRMVPSAGVLYLDEKEKP